MDLDNPRRLAKQAIQATVPPDLWERNRSFVQELQETIHNHRLVGHSAGRALADGQFTKEDLARIHLEYRHAGVKIFTDALLIAQLLTKQVESRLGPGSKMPSRFLLTLNALDEFGFRPGVDQDGYYRGNPALAHYPLFEDLLDQLGVGREERETYTPTPVADALHHNLESAYQDLAVLTLFLTIAEKQVVLFSPPLRAAVMAVGIDVKGGYYEFHGTSDEEEWTAYDDDHEDDLWYILMQALTPEQYEPVRARAEHYLGLWAQFWDEQMKLWKAPMAS
ncbi:MAG: hypothetical protein ACLFRB_10270 [Thiohalorhabdus sp.]|uniref:hypothetical protein n=1 Tax=Thiohalorhabdus sp. TaxID=3094134 RepID=UPI00398098F6